MIDKGNIGEMGNNEIKNGLEKSWKQELMYLPYICSKKEKLGNMFKKGEIRKVAPSIIRCEPLPKKRMF